MNLERLRKQRTWAVVALFAFAVLIYFGGTVDAVAPSTVGVAREFRLKYEDSVLVGDANGRAYLYYKGGSTVGVGIELSLVASKSVWRWADMDTGRVIMIYHYDDNRTVKCLDSLLVEGTSLPDTFLTRPESIADDVIRGYHINEENVWPQHMHPDSSYDIKIGSGGDVNVDAMPAAAVLESEWGTLFHDSFGDTLAAGNLDAVFDTCTVESLLQATRIKIDSIFVYDSSLTWMQAIDPDSIVYPAGLITAGAVAWGAGGDSVDADDVAASATRLWAPAPGGSARLMISDGASVWQGVDPAGDVEIGPTGATLIQVNVIDAERLESTDNPASGDLVGVAAADAFTHQTPSERGLQLTAAFDDSLAAQGFPHADSTGGPLATRYWVGQQGYTGATAWDDIGNPDADATIAFGGYEQTLSTTLDEASHTVLTLNHTAADVVNQIYMMEISSVDNDDNSISYLRIIDDTGGTPDVLFEFDANAVFTIADGGGIVGAGDLYWLTVGDMFFQADSDQGDYLVIDCGADTPTLKAELANGFKFVLSADSRVISVEDTLGLGTASAAEHMIIHNAGTVRIYDSADDTSVLLGPVGNGTTILDVTGTIDADGLKVGGADVLTSETGDIEGVTAGDGLGGGGTTGTVTLDALLDYDGGLEAVDDSINVKAASITNAMLAGSIDLTTKVTGTLPEANGGTGDTDLDDIIGGDGLHATDGANTIIAGNATLKVLLDYDGAIETTDDSLNVKLDGVTLTKSASGLKVADDNIKEVHLDCTNSPTVGYVPLYEVGGGFTWAPFDTLTLEELEDYSAAMWDSTYASPSTITYVDAGGELVIVVDLDYDGGIESVDDSLNIKLNGSTLALSASGLLVSTVAGVTGANEDDVTAADVGAASPSLDATTAVLLLDYDGGLEAVDDSINVKAASITNAMLAGGIDLTTKVTGTLPEANGGTGDTDLDDIIGGDGLVVTDGANTIIAGNATLAVLLDYDGALETIDDSVNVKLDGVTLTKSASGLKVTDSTYQPLDAQLTDLADGTLTGDFVNTANPWADNEVANDITCSNYVLLAAYADSFDVNMDGEKIIKEMLIEAPDGINAEVEFLYIDPLVYPNGITLKKLAISLPADAAYSMVFEEWAGDPPVWQNNTETVTTGGTDAYMAVVEADIDDKNLDASDMLYLDIPATDVPRIKAIAIFVRD